MSATKVAITIQADLLQRLDRLVAERRFPSRSRAIQEAVRAQVERMDRRRLALESSKLDPRCEQELAEEGVSYDLEGWPEY